MLSAPNRSAYTAAASSHCPGREWRQEDVPHSAALPPARRAKRLQRIACIHQAISRLDVSHEIAVPPNTDFGRVEGRNIRPLRRPGAKPGNVPVDAARAPALSVAPDRSPAGRPTISRYGPRPPRRSSPSTRAAFPHERRTPRSPQTCRRSSPAAGCRKSLHCIGRRNAPSTFSGTPGGPVLPLPPACPTTHPPPNQFNPLSGLQSGMAPRSKEEARHLYKEKKEEKSSRLIRARPLIERRPPALLFAAHPGLLPARRFVDWKGLRSGNPPN